MFPTIRSPWFGRCIFLAFFGLLAVGNHACAQTASQIYNQGAEAYSRGDVQGAKQKLQTALQIDRNFRPASALLTRIAQEKARADSPGATQTLERTIIPVEFNNTNLDDALGFIREKVAADSGNKLVINFALNLSPEVAHRKITLKMERVPVLEVLRYIGELTAVKFDRQQYAIVVSPAADKVPAAVPMASPPQPFPRG